MIGIAQDHKKYRPITGKKINAFFKNIDGIEKRSVQKTVSQADWCFIAYITTLFFEGTLPITLISVFSHHFIPLVIIRHQILFTKITTGLGNKRHGKHIVTKILVPI